MRKLENLPLSCWSWCLATATNVARSGAIGPRSRPAGPCSPPGEIVPSAGRVRCENLIIRRRVDVLVKTPGGTDPARGAAFASSLASFCIDRARSAKLGRYLCSVLGAREGRTPHPTIAIRKPAYRFRVPSLEASWMKITRRRSL
jgi:hypothetical protein